MADPIQKTFEAVRTALVNDETLTALVSASNIRPANVDVGLDFPAIRIRIEGGEDNDFPNSVRGRVYIHAFHQGAKPFTTINQIQDAIKDVLHHKETSVSNVSIDIKYLVRSHLTTMIPEIEMAKGTFSKVAYYDYIAQTK